MGIVREESSKSKCGSDMMAQELEKRMPPELMDKFQIFVSYKHAEIEPTKYRILWVHDTPNQVIHKDLVDGGWNVFHKIVFPSNWLMQIYINIYNLPWDRCVVLQNAIEPIDNKTKPTDKIRLIYTSAPNRGLNILFSVFKELSKTYSNLELVVCSSFRMYGMDNFDHTHYKQLLDELQVYPNVKYYGYMPNAEVRKLLQSSHIFAYPCVHPETSCISLIEAMSAGCVCVHPNSAALFETASNFNAMYHFDPDSLIHAEKFHSQVEQSINEMKNPFISAMLDKQKSYITRFYNWDYRSAQWKNFLESIVYEHEGYPGE
jgi:glycosyltransferase involved in cell wall biosynthesis